MTAAVTILKLTKRFPRYAGYRQLLPWKQREEVTALDDVSLDVAEGELFGLLGPNGAGKTTLMKILSTLVLPTSGRALLYGKDVVASEAEARSMVGLISADERSFYWRLTGRQNLEFFAALYQLPGRKARRRVDDLLELLGMADVADQRFHSYSTGMRQKMAIARGLLSNPRVLLVDEPTRSLDPLSAQEVRTFLKEKVASTGCTVLMATHQMSEAEQLCDRVAVLRRGRLIACGTVADLKQALGRDRCYLEVGCLGIESRRQLARIPGVVDLQATNRSDGTTALHVVLADRQAALPSLLRAVVAAGGQIYNCNVQERPLEEIFVEMVGDASAGEYQVLSEPAVVVEAGALCR
ncbi:MAG: ATP-binding cassette domain-containing protein [Chloroflexota bacterium]|jgi:ABC-2 type transport system ATP-binding protein